MDTAAGRGTMPAPRETLVCPWGRVNGGSASTMREETRMITRALVLIGLTSFLWMAPARAAVDPFDLCTEKKLKATGDNTIDLFKGFGKNLKSPNTTRLTGDLSKAQSKITKKYSSAEFTGSGDPKDCNTVGDVGAIETKVEEFVAQQLSMLESGPASAKEITNASECVAGPLSRCRVGDYLIENGRVRVVIQGLQRNMMGIGQFGGQIIDADLRRAPGDPERDNFEEWATAINIENTAHYTDIDIINDGTDCEPAIIRVTGPDDLLDFINPSSVVASFGFNLPAALDDTDLPVEFSTDYILAPNANWVRVETTVTNTSGSVVSTYFGEWLNGSGQIDLFQPGYGFGEALVTTGCIFTATNPCDAVVYRGVDEAAGVSYGYIHEGNAPGDPPFDPHRGTTTFTASGVTVPILGREIALVLIGSSQGLPNFILQPNGNPGDTLLRTRYFAIGDGTVSSILETRNTIKGITRGTLAGTVTDVSGNPLAGADVAVIGDLSQGPSKLGPITRNVVNHTETNPDGSYSLTLPPGNYDVAVNKEGHPYQGGGSTPAVNPVVIAANTTTVQDMTVPDAGTLVVNVTDGTNPIPAKASVVGFDPSPPLISSQAIVGLIQNRTSVFREAGQDARPFGVNQVMFIEPTGTSDTIPIEPGSYQVVVSRGPEYSSASSAVAVAANALSTVDAEIAPVIDTSGYVSGDFHVHSIYSADSEVTERERIVTMLSEGLEFFTPSDHENRREFQSTIIAENWDDLVTTATSGEITSFDYGHFNAWPMTINPAQVNGGAVDHGGAAPAGDDFPAYGNYNRTPAEIIAAAHLDPGTDTVQINHVASHFGVTSGGTDLGSGLAIDTGLEPPMSVVQPSARRLDPADESGITGYFTDTFDALEIWIGDDRDQIFGNFLGQNAGDWFNMLNQGIVRTGIADSDTHNRLTTNAGVPRTMIASSETDLTELDPETLSATVNSGRAIGTNAPMVRGTVKAITSGLEATLEEGDNTIVSAADGKVEITVDVQSPTWAEFDRIEFYLNSATTQTILANRRVGPNLFVDAARYAIGADVVHNDGAEFNVSTVTGLVPSVPGSDRFEATTTLTFDGLGGNPAPLTEDTWIVVMVKGTDGVSKPLYPIIPNSLKTSTNTTLANLIDGNLGEDGILALAFTNPLFVDVDDGAAGPPDGDYDPPGVQCVATLPHPNCVTP
jgi:hypothetical protein